MLLVELLFHGLVETTSLHRYAFRLQRRDSHSDLANFAKRSEIKGLVIVASCPEVRGIRKSFALQTAAGIPSIYQ
jgi:hypothetical protein